MPAPITRIHSFARPSQTLKPMKINKVAVIGAGTMGAGIAGQVANAGIHVYLLDLPGDEKPNALAERGLERLRDPDQPGLISNEAESFIHLGNTRDDFDQLADCDWVAEAVVERLDIPSYLILAGQDRLTPLKAGKVLAEKLKAEYSVIEGYGHMLPIEAPKQCLHQLRESIASLDQVKR